MPNNSAGNFSVIYFKLFWLYHTLLFFFLINTTASPGKKEAPEYPYQINSVVTLTKKEDARIALKNVAVPDLIGMTVKDAEKIMSKKGLEIGAIITPSEIDSTKFDSQIIFKQRPSPRNRKGVQRYILKGQLIDIWAAGQIPISDTLKKTRQTIRAVVTKTN